MPLIKAGKAIEDTWAKVGGETPVEGDSDVIVDWTRLKEDRSLEGRNGRLGVLLANTVEANDLAPYLPRLSLIVLDFPSFTDGRAFSQARVLRHQLGFNGEIRATGAPKADQAPHLTRCGFDAIEVSDKQPLESWAHAEKVVAHVFQDGYSNGGLVSAAVARKRQA